MVRMFKCLPTNVIVDMFRESRTSHLSNEAECNHAFRILACMTILIDRKATDEIVDLGEVVEGTYGGWTTVVQPYRR